MQRLAEAGMTFDNAFVVSPSCAPSRAALLTGMYPARNGAEPNHSRPRVDLKKLPAYLQELGYEVVSYGKVGHYRRPINVRHDFEQLRRVIRETVLPEYEHEIREANLKWVAHRARIWVRNAGEDSYFGQTMEAALLTAWECDWIFLSSHPPMLDDWTWFDDRLAYGEVWKHNVVPMKREESRERVATNYCLGEA